MKLSERQQWLRNARQYLKDANDGASNLRKNKTKRSTITSNFIDKAPTVHIEENISLYVKTSQAFLIVGKWRDAAFALGQAAGIYHFELDLVGEAAELYTEAGLLAEKIFILDGIEYFKKAVTLYCECEKYRQAARIRKWMGERYEELGDYKQAINQYKMTAQYYKASSGSSGFATMSVQVLACLRKVGFLTASLGPSVYNEASIVYREIAREELRNNLTKYSARHSIFRAILLILGSQGSSPNKDCDRDTNVEDAKRALHEMMQLDVRFETWAGRDFLICIINIIKREDGTLHEFSDHLFEYNELYPFDELNLDILNNIYSLYFSPIEIEMDRLAVG